MVAAAPNWAESVTAVTAIVTALGVIGAALAARYAGAQVKEAQKSRYAETALEMSRRWEAEELVEVRKKTRSYRTPEELREKYLESATKNSEEYYLFARELSYFEDLGIFEKFGALPVEWIEATLQSVIRDRWALWKPTIEHLHSTGHRTWYENFENLAEQLEERAQARGGTEALETRAAERWGRY